MANVSIGAMIQQLAPLLSKPNDLKDWEKRFLAQVMRSTGEGKRTSILTGDQVEKVAEIWKRHFEATEKR